MDEEGIQLRDPDPAGLVGRLELPHPQALLDGMRLKDRIEVLLLHLRGDARTAPGVMAQPGRGIEPVRAHPDLAVFPDHRRQEHPRQPGPGNPRRPGEACCSIPVITAIEVSKGGCDRRR